MKKEVSDSLKEYARGITGGLLFSLPLLFTMEVWWTGTIVQAYQLIIYVSITFLLLLGYNRFAGLHQDVTWAEVVIDSIEEMGLGLLLSLFILWAIGQVNVDSLDVDQVMGKVIVESMTVAIGISVGTAQLGAPAPEETGDKKTANQNDVLAKLVMAICGSILIASNVAPTEEIMLIVLKTTYWHLLVIVFFSLLLGGVIVFFIDFRGGKQPGRLMWLTVSSDTTVAYIISLASSACMLWFFGRFSGNGFDTCLGLTIVLGLPAMLGASAGRLLIK